MKNVNKPLCLLWAVVFFGLPIYSKVIKLPGIVNPNSITVGDDYVYIGDFPSFHIHSLKDYTLVKKFGNKGEGPKEWLKFSIPTLHKGQLVFGDRNKMLFFSLSGEYIEEFKSKFLMHWGGRPFGNGYLAESRVTEKEVQYQTVLFYDPGLDGKLEIRRDEFFFQSRKSGKKCNVVKLGGVHFDIYKENVYFRKNFDFALEVFGRTGRKLRTISLPYTRLAFTEAVKERYRQYLQTTLPWRRMYAQQLEKEIFFPAKLPAIQCFTVADDRIYVLTYETKADRSKFIILDLEGKKIKEAWLPFPQTDDWFQHSMSQWIRHRSSHPTFCIKGHTLYRLIAEEDGEEWELHITKVD
ncbi:MAG: hypothetical protein GY765_27140 [bacterium]|nr:hypothetical protein [bacterium]